MYAIRSYYEDGSHAQDFKDFAFGRHELKPSYIHVFGMPVKAQKIRLSSTHHTNVHIRELRVYAPGKGSYPEDAEEETQGLINLARAKGTTITASGQYHDVITSYSIHYTKLYDLTKNKDVRIAYQYIHARNNFV